MIFIDYGFNFNMLSVVENEKDWYVLFLFKYYLSIFNIYRWVIFIWGFKIIKWFIFMMVIKINFFVCVIL